jgi:catechol 2,3-dioxygenase
MNPFASVTTGPAAEGHSTLPATLRLGAVHLVVTDLDRSVAWYQAALGMRVHRQDVGVAALGDGEEDVVVLREDATATPPPRRPAPGRHAHADPGRVGPRHARGDLPGRSGRQRP